MDDDMNYFGFYDFEHDRMMAEIHDLILSHTGDWTYDNDDEVDEISRKYNISFSQEDIETIGNWIWSLKD